MSQETSYYCDKCMKKTSYKELNNLILNRHSLLDIWDKEHFELELCNDCVKKIKKFLEGLK